MDPQDIRGPRDEDVGVGLFERLPLVAAHAPELRLRQGPNGPPVRFLVLEYEHGARAHGSKLVHEFRREGQPVVP